MFGISHLAPSGLFDGGSHQIGLRPTLQNPVPSGQVPKGRNMLGSDDNPTRNMLGSDDNPTRNILGSDDNPTRNTSGSDNNPTRLDDNGKSPERAIYNKI